MTRCLSKFFGVISSGGAGLTGEKVCGGKFGGSVTGEIFVK